MEVWRQKAPPPPKYPKVIKVCGQPQSPRPYGICSVKDAKELGLSWFHKEPVLACPGIISLGDSGGENKAEDRLEPSGLKKKDLFSGIKGQEAMQLRQGVIARKQQHDSNVWSLVSWCLLLKVSPLSTNSSKHKGHDPRSARHRRMFNHTLP